eukprot:TRINITY_DN3267_c0_g1_i1.p1 TRINITY_DN3267_c0_g1~~TRINITY_DN3267_c0_g1_i1.p1  ORF type:complete len:308 (-),score=56.13 TRINITY_DN3267_c0_g1_i1:34-927(-)
MEAGSGRVHIVESQEDAMLLASTIARGGLVVVDFSAQWCGPCHSIFPVLVQLSQRPEFSAIEFFKVDVDQHKALAEAVQVTSLPTFMLYREGTRTETVIGANPTKLEQALRKLNQVAASSGADDTVTFPSGHIDLIDFVDVSHVTCLNQSSDHPVQNAFSRDSKYLESDCDEQLLIYVPFKQPIKLHSLGFVAPADGKGPKSVKVYANNPHMDFSSTDGPATQDFQLKPDELKDTTLTPVRFVKFQNVTALTIFVESNQGDAETSVLTTVRFIGQSVDGSDMKNFKRVMGEKNEAHE